MSNATDGGNVLESKILDRVSHLMRDLGLANSKSLLVVAVSGGPDSLALLLLLDKLRPSLGLSLHVAHLDHGLRKDSKEDADLVESVSKKMGLPFTLARKNVQSYRVSRRLSLEEAGREVRYSFLSNVAAAQGADCVALGHTVNDQVETILMHLLRGSGLSGLAGMSPLVYWPSQKAERRIRLLRPLLEVTRAETESYCRFIGIKPREDSTNQSLQFTRNRIRLDLIPKLKEYNPRFPEALLRLSRSASQDQKYLMGEAAIAKQHLGKASEGGFEIERKEFNVLPHALKAHLLRLTFQELKGSTIGLGSRHLEDMIRLSLGQSGRRLDLPRGLAFFVEYHSIRIGLPKNGAPSSSILTQEYQLEIPGDTLIPGWTVQVRTAERNTALFHMSSYAVFLDKEAAGKHLHVRGRKAGDRFHPLGMARSKKLQDFFVDVKVPRILRDETPLVVSERGIVWVVGHRIAHWAQATHDTKEVLELNFSPTSST